MCLTLLRNWDSYQIGSHLGPLRWEPVKMLWLIQRWTIVIHHNPSKHWAATIQCRQNCSDKRFHGPSCISQHEQQGMTMSRAKDSLSFCHLMISCCPSCLSKLWTGPISDSTPSQLFCNFHYLVNYDDHRMTDLAACWSCAKERAKMLTVKNKITEF